MGGSVVRGLDKILDGVSYRNIGGYRPSKFALKFVEFVKLVNGGKPENKTPVFHYKLIDSILSYPNTLSLVFRGGAKALALDTPIMMPGGMHELMGDANVGDVILDRYGEECRVIKCSEIYRNRAYVIVLSDGQRMVANEDHLHIVEVKKGRRWVEGVYSTKELIELYCRDVRMAIPMCNVVRGYSVLEKNTIERIEDIDEVVETRCIQTDSPSRSYLIYDGIVTHNSSLIEYMILYLAVFGKIDGFSDIQLGMYVSDTMENGVKNMRNNLEFRYNNSEFLKKYVPRTKFTDPEWEFINADGHELTFKGFGIVTGVRGFKKYGIRPQIAFLDDLLSDRNADSKAVTEDIEQVIYKAIRQAMHPEKRRIAWTGTPFNMKDPLYKAAGSSGWHTVAFPICEKWPCSREEFVGAWEDRFNYDFVKKEYELLKSNGRVDAFNQELMLRIMTDDDKLVHDEDIVWKKRSLMLENLKSCNVYITTDFATSETEKSDFSVISVWALDTDGVFNWIDGICKRQDMAKNVDDLFRFVDIYHPLSTGVEISGQQKGFVNWIKREMNLRGKYFMLATDKASGEEGLRPNTSKLTRFNIALPLFKQRKIAFPEELKETTAMEECLEEIMSVTPGGFKSRHDDFADTISQLPLLEYFVPGKEEEMHEKRKEIPVRSFAGSRYFTVDSAYGIGSPYIV